MHFSNFAFAAVLTLANIVASQVVVTVTNTVTIVTVTVTPLSTSTSTKYVTVSGTTSREQTITSTSVVIVTVAPPTTTAVTTCPIPLYYQCGGREWTGCTSCTAGASCVSANEWYYQCQAKTPKVVTVTSTIWPKI